MHGEMVVGGIVAFSLMKKVAAYGIARYYGFPKLYRKLARANQKLAPTAEQATSINGRVRTVFRWPNRAAARISGAMRAVRARMEGQPDAKKL